MTIKLAKMPEEKKTRNPLKKLLRSHSQSLHPAAPAVNELTLESAALPNGRSRSSTLSKSDASAQAAPPVGVKRAHTVLGNHKPVHNTNPFSSTNKAGTSHPPYGDILGTGQSISGPRNSAHPTNFHSTSPYNPSPFPLGSSRTPSQMSVHGPGNAELAKSFEDEKDNILPYPVAEPNDHLPEALRQPGKSAFADYFVIPDAKSGKDIKLGEGASASVRVVQHRATHKFYALKKFLLLDKETPEHLYSRAAKEFVIAKNLSGNDHMVDTYALMKIQTTSYMNRGWGFILEYCKGGDLFSLISRTGWKSSPLNEKLCLFKQVAYGVKFMHERGIVHRDLKPENVLITEKGVCKLTDFGVADYYHEDPFDLTSPVKLGSNYVGSPPYVPPEVAATKQKFNHSQSGLTYNPVAPDMWALGMILFCLVYQGTPFQIADSCEAAYREYNQTYKRFVSEHPSFKGRDFNVGPGSEFKYAKEFQSPHTARLAWKLCDYNADTRYTMDDLFSDPAFTTIECCVDEESNDHSIAFNEQCNEILAEPKSPVSAAASVKASPQIRSRSMLDFTSIPTVPLTSSPPSPITSSAATTPPQSSGSANVSDSQQAVNLPTLDEVSESVSTSPTTDMMMDKLTIDTQVGENFYNSQSAAVAPSTDSLLTFSPRTTFSRGSPPSRSMIEDLTNGVSSPVPPHSSPQVTSAHTMNRASSFSSVASPISTRSSSSLSIAKKKKHNHLDISNVQNRSSFIKKK